MKALSGERVLRKTENGVFARIYNRFERGKMKETKEVEGQMLAGEANDSRFFNEEHMYAFLEGKLASGQFPEAQRALPYAREKHKTTKPRGGPGNVPYISHPLMMTCHALAMGLEDDILLAALLLHDVTEDCFIPPEEMPVCSEVQEIVSLVSKNKESYDAQKYFDAIAENPRACMVKCIDRCNNLSSMAAAFSGEDEGIHRRDGDLVPEAAGDHQGGAELQQRSLAAQLPDQKRDPDGPTLRVINQAEPE